jgi:hypothetical protein
MKKNSNLSRREFLKASVKASAGALFLPAFAKHAMASALYQNFANSSEDSHFFFLLTLPNASGLDASYLWDARPNSMTAQGIIQNYRNGPEATPWTGSNGVSTLATDLVRPLLPFQSDFSVMNGVLMDVGFDGHEQNINYLFTGDPFGGECFVPHLNLTGAHKALDAIQRGRYLVSQTNGGQMVPLNPSAAHSLITSLAKVPPIDPRSRLHQYLSNRFQSIGIGPGGFSAGSSMMNDSYNGASNLSKLMSQVQTDGLDTDAGFVRLANEVFKTGTSKSAVMVLDPAGNVFDTHDATSAFQQPTTYRALANQLSTVISTMKTTPFDGTRSMLDVTTVMFAAEFGRTLRQKHHAIDATGTDHNPLSNCILLGGKGIKGGQVIGSSDFASSSEILSGAHLSLDADRLKLMGRPFDFGTSRSRTDLPASYSATDYLGINSIVNTLYQLFNVPVSKYRKVERNGALAPILTGILS